MGSDDVVKSLLVAEINRYVWAATIQAARGAPSHIFERNFDEAYLLADEFLGSDRERFTRQINLARKQIYECD